MSHVLLLAADRPLPLWDGQELRTLTLPSGETLTTERGFLVDKLSYYRQSVEELNYPIRPCRYELSMERDSRDFLQLKNYLRQNLSPGETVELWSLWVGDPEEARWRFPPNRSGTLEELNESVLEMLLTEDYCRLTVTV